MFYDRVKSLCKEKDISLAFLANTVGLSNSATTYWKRGSIPKIETAKKIADYFGVSLDWLLYGTTDDDLAFEALVNSLAEYGFNAVSDDSNLAWCYIYPSAMDDDPCFDLFNNAKHLPISHIESELKKIIATAERKKKEYIVEHVYGLIESPINEADILLLQHIGDL